MNSLLWKSIGLMLLLVFVVVVFFSFSKTKFTKTGQSIQDYCKETTIEQFDLSDDQGVYLEQDGIVEISPEVYEYYNNCLQSGVRVHPPK